MTINTLLIANRGEIAVRIARTAPVRDQDRRGLPSRRRRRAHQFHGRRRRSRRASPAESYLRGDAIIAAALATGADAIHPGYGFWPRTPLPFQGMSSPRA